MKKATALISAAIFLAIASSPAAAAMGLMSEYNYGVVKAAGPEKEIVLKDVGALGGLYFPGEKVQVTLRKPKADTSIEGMTLEVVAVDTRKAAPGEVGFVIEKEAPRLSLTDVPAAKFDLAKAQAQDTLLVADLPVSERFGLYVLVLQRPDGSRTVLGSVARVVKPAETPKGDIPQIMSECNVPEVQMSDSNCVDVLARAYARMGVRLMRWEVGWGLESKPGVVDWPRMDGIRSFDKAGIKIMCTLGAHPSWAMPFGEPTPAVSPRKPDCTGLEKYDPNFGDFISNLVQRYWTGGKAGLWGLEHWNEPWEPTSISGWSSDSVRYRSLLKIISTRAKAVAADIKVLSACSIMNTEDKLLSTDSNEWVRYVDIFTDHYVTPRNAYGPMVAARWGKMSGETETWGATNEVLLPQFLTQFLALGQKFINPWMGEMVFENPGGRKAPMLTPKTLAVAHAAWSALIADRPFNKIAFSDRLPWLYQFGPDADAVFVLYGKAMPIASGDPRDVVWPQAAAGPEGTLTLADPQGLLEIMDSAGNVLPAKNKTYEIPMSTSSFYVRSAKGAAAVIEAIGAGKLTGLQPVEILPQALAALPQAAKPATLTVKVHNLGNADLAGELAAESPVAGAITSPAQKVKMKAGQTVSVDVTIAALPQGGGLPAKFTFSSPAGNATWQEVIQPAVISRLATPDQGRDASAWAKLPGVTVLRPEGKVEGDIIEKLWLPYMQKAAETVPARKGEVKLAWDDQNVYIFASADANQNTPKLRLETWDEQPYFHDANSPQLDARYAEFVAKKAAQKPPVQVNFADAPHVYRAPFAQDMPFNGDVFQFAFDTDPAASRYTRTHDLKYPSNIPEGFCATPDTDYEFCLYTCQDGNTELWCLLAPGVPRTHHFPHQPHGAVDQHAVKTGTAKIVHENGKTTYTISLPWKELGMEKPQAGQDLGFTFRFGASKGAALEFGQDLAATKNNGLSLHPYWMPKASCTVRWTLLP